MQTTPHTSAHLDVLDEVCSAVGNLLGCLHKVSLGNRVVSLAARNLARIAQDTRVLSNHCSCCQHLGGVREGGGRRGSEVVCLNHLHYHLGDLPPPLSSLFPCSSLPTLLPSPLSLLPPSPLSSSSSLVPSSLLPPPSSFPSSFLLPPSLLPPPSPLSSPAAVWMMD